MNASCQALIEALHAPQRTSAPKLWRQELEKWLDVDLFLNWLAVTAALGNWDVYGTTADNFFLYADPCNKNRFRWIPWDNSKVLASPIHVSIIDSFFACVSLIQSFTSSLLSHDVMWSSVSDEFPLTAFLLEVAFFFFQSWCSP